VTDEQAEEIQKEKEEKKGDEEPLIEEVTDEQADAILKAKKDLKTETESDNVIKETKNKDN